MGFEAALAAAAAEEEDALPPPSSSLTACWAGLAAAVQVVALALRMLM